MQQTQLIQLLKVLNESELKALKTFLKGKPEKIRKAMNPLFNYLIKFAPTYESPKLSRVVVLKKVFKGLPFTNQQLNKLAFQLKSYIEEFLVVYDITQNSMLKDQLLLQALAQRNHPDYAKESQALITKFLHKPQKELTAKDSLDLFQLNYALWSNINTRKTETDIEIFRRTNKHLDAFYLREKMKLILETKTSKSIINETTHFSEVFDLPFSLEKHYLLSEYPVIQLFSKAIQMVDSSEIADYQVVKKALLKTIHQLTIKDAQDIFITLINYINKYSGKKPAFGKKEAFELYAFAHENNLLVENGRMRYIEYSNAAMAGIITQNFDWSAAFIQENKKFLAPEVRELVYTYIQAFYHFQKKEFNQVIKLLKSIDLMQGFTYNLDINIRTLNLRTLFERWIANNYLPEEEQGMLISQINSFEGYIIGHKRLSVIKKENYVQFVRFFKSTVNTIKVNNLQIDQLKRLQKDLTATNSVALREWLEHTLERLIGNLPHK